MALQIPIFSPLTDSQAELTSKIGSMKNLLSLPFEKSNKISKDKQISTFDYLLKILSAMGLTPEIIFKIFFDKVFDSTTDFLEDKILRALASSIARKGRDLSSSTPPIASPTPEEIETLTESNYQKLKAVIPTNFLSTVKQAMLKEFVNIIFGPKDKIGSAITPALTPTQKEELFQQVICGINLFTINSTPILREEDVEFNKIKLRRQLEQGNVEYEISCQTVKIKLPENTGFIFEGGGIYTLPSTSLTPGGSMQILVSYVTNQIQNINNQNNANSGGKSFWQILIEKLLNYISTIVIYFLGPVFSIINTLPNGSGLNINNVCYNPCLIQNDPEDEDKKAFTKSLANQLLKELLSTLLIYAIREFKKLVKNYFARTAREKIRRKIQETKLKYKIFNKTGDSDKAIRFRAAAATLSSLLVNINS